MTNKLSRSTEINTEQCNKNVGNNRFDLVIIAATRAREILRRHRHAGITAHINAPVQALFDIQEGRVGREYLKKI
jgi:DNA-directed RNA polymerase omega subunit